MSTIEFHEAATAQDYHLAAGLFKEYAAQLGVDLTFQDFKTELENIEQIYHRPDGAILVVYINNNELVGCVGIRK